MFLNQKGEENFIKIVELRDKFFSVLHEEIDPFPEVCSDMHADAQSALQACEDTFNEQSQSEQAQVYR